MDFYSVRKKVIQISVLLMGVIVLCGCGKWQKYDGIMPYEKELPVVPIWDSDSEILEEDINMPEIEKHSFSVEITIRNDEEYEVFINMLDDFTIYNCLELNMSGTSTTVYLDEIMAYGNFTSLTITNGGIIAIKNEDDFEYYPLESFYLHDVFNMPEIEAEKKYSRVNVTIRNTEEYEVFINMLNAFANFSTLALDMSGTSTTVYLDEITACGNFTSLIIWNGGIIATKNEDDFEYYLLKTFWISDVFNMPGMVSLNKNSSSVKVIIQNSEEYEAFISLLKDITDYSILELDMSGTNTTVYLDEIMEGGNFTSLKISNGGIITIKNKDNFEDYPLESFELYNVFEIAENLLSHVSTSGLLVFEMGDNYSGSVPIKELLDKTDCKKIAILTDKKLEGGLHYGKENYVDVFGQEGSFCQVPCKEDRVLREIYRVNEGDYSYTSYEFYKPESKEEVCAVYIGVDYREGDDERCIAMLQVPENRYTDIRRQYVYGDQIWVKDVNFDGYKDICFSGDDDTYLYDLYCVFLWNEQEKRYTICDTAPRNISHIDSEKKRLTHTIFHGTSGDEYYIYEYRNGIYHEKKLENIFCVEEYLRDGTDRTIWNYSEDGELKETLEYIFNKDENTSYITHQGKRGTEEEVLEGEQDYMEVGKKYFPEFDFYWLG